MPAHPCDVFGDFVTDPTVGDDEIVMIPAEGTPSEEIELGADEFRKLGCFHVGLCCGCGLCLALALLASVGDYRRAKNNVQSEK
jgi:hypothetical protein